MAGAIKGVTIEFQGDTTKLDKALRQIDKQTASIDKELKQVNNALKFNPKNVDLLRQKQELLGQKIAETSEKLKLLKETQAKVDSGEIEMSAEDYRTLQREIIQAESKLKTFEAQQKKVDNAIKGMDMQKVSDQFKKYGDNLTKAGNAMKPFSAAGAAVVAGLGAMSAKAGMAADDLNTLSKVTGIGTADLQKYGYAADLVDVSVEAIAKSNKRLTKSAYDAANGSKTQSEAFEAIGVSVTDANGNLRDSDAIFQDVISALGKMTNETQRDALAQKLMGKSAAELNPLIEDGGETYKMVADTLAKYNLDYVDQQTLDKANAFNDSLDTMKLIGSVALSQVSSQLAAYLAPALEKVVGLVGRFAEWLSNLDPRILSVIGVIGALVAGVAPLLIIFGKVAFAISSITGLMATMGISFAAIAGPIGIAIAAIAAIIAIGVLLYKNWDTVKAKAAGLKTFVISAFSSLKGRVQSIFNGIKTAITKPIQTAVNIVRTAINKIKSILRGKLSFPKIKLPHFNISGKFSLNPPSVPKLGVKWYDKGGIFDSPSVIGVGEKRPEFVGALDDLRKIVREETGGENITFNIYAAPGMDVRKIADAVEQRLVEREKQRRAAWGY